MIEEDLPLRSGIYDTKPKSSLVTPCYREDERISNSMQACAIKPNGSAKALLADMQSRMIGLRAAKEPCLKFGERNDVTDLCDFALGESLLTLHIYL